MYIVAIHSISDPEAFWGGSLDLPAGTTLPGVLPSGDGTRGVCIFESDSLDTVRDVVDSATGHVSTNEYYEVAAENAQGLPSSAVRA
jgi:hypothetical protein